MSSQRTSLDDYEQTVSRHRDISMSKKKKEKELLWYYVSPSHTISTGGIIITAGMKSRAMHHFSLSASLKELQSVNSPARRYTALLRCCFIIQAKCVFSGNIHPLLLCILCPQQSWKMTQCAVERAPGQMVLHQLDLSLYMWPNKSLHLMQL